MEQCGVCDNVTGVEAQHPQAPAALSSCPEAGVRHIHAPAPRGGILYIDYQNWAVSRFVGRVGRNTRKSVILEPFWGLGVLEFSSPCSRNLACGCQLGAVMPAFGVPKLCFRKGEL